MSARVRIPDEADQRSGMMSISILQPGQNEIVVDKDRYCAFSGNDLKDVLRSGGINHLVMPGVATSGVILSTFTLAANEDYSITILSDACADPKASLHEELMIVG